MKTLSLILLLVSTLALAESDPRLVRLEAAYNRAHQEQQAMYQQFQMIQELRRNELQQMDVLPGGGRGMPAVNAGKSLDYDENVRQERARQEQLQRYEREIAQSYARFLELGQQKKALLDQINALPPLPVR